MSSTRPVLPGLPAARRGVLLFALIGFALSLPAAAKKSPPTRRVEVTAEVFGTGRTPEEARREALERAREKAVAEVTGVDIAAQQLRLKSENRDEVLDAFTSIVRTTTRGRILSEQAVYQTLLRDSIPVYRVHLTAEVAVDKGERNPGFHLQLHTTPESPTLREGDLVTVELDASIDCYVTLLNLWSDDTVAVLFPNRYQRDNRLVAGHTLRLPASGSGLEYRADLAAGKRRDREMLLAIATLDPTPFRFASMPGDDPPLPVGDLETVLTALNRWLVGIPLDRRAEATWIYEIVE
jgi:hypothetical protein